MVHATRLKRWTPLLAATLAATACNFPEVPPYPWGSNTNKGTSYNQALVEAEAQQLSDDLYDYIDGWFNGQNPAHIPDHLIPSGNDFDNVHSYTLIPESAIDPATQWGQRPHQGPINLNDSIGQFPDPHVAYLLMPGMVAPFGTKIIVEGEFPHARYFSIQPTAATYPLNYVYGGGFGSGEVAFVDADIDPLPGHTNPFRVGANRNASNRGFRVTCTATMGDPTALDPAAWTSPNFRQAGNSRSCGTFVFRGPWGDPDWKAQDDINAGDGRGVWGTGDMWVRVYAPDHAYLPWGGMPFPKVTYELPDGRRFFIQKEFSDMVALLNTKGPVPPTDPANPNSAGIGWLKQWGILRIIAEGQIGQFGWMLPYTNLAGLYSSPEQYVHELDKGVTGRFPTAPSISKLEPHATGSVHIAYLARTMCSETGRVYVVSGTMPTVPNTRGGAATMTGGQARYWSLTGYSTLINDDPITPSNVPGQLITSLMDDEIVLDSQRRYIIVYSRAADRPSNATAANGVTWVNQGPQGCQAFTLRWMNIGPEWTFAQAPNATNAGWNTSIATPGFNPTILHQNNRNGLLGAYHPVISYRTKSQFQGYGSTNIFGKLPAY